LRGGGRFAAEQVAEHAAENGPEHGTDEGADDGTDHRHEAGADLSSELRPDRGADRPAHGAHGRAGLRIRRETRVVEEFAGQITADEAARHVGERAAVERLAQT
jgi:hypothetical protein